MAIPLQLLRSTESRALGFVVYGGPGTRKSNAIHTLPPPILMHDFEGGSASVLPWIRRRRSWNSTEWVEYTQEERLAAFNALNDENKTYIREVTRINPNPYIDVVWYDNMDASVWGKWVQDLAQIDWNNYNSVACDSLQEQTGAIKTTAKGSSNVMDKMATSLWGEVQDRSVAALRYYRNLRQKGVFVYLTCSESIDKEYVTDPRNQKRGQEELPYSIKGNVNVSGQVVQAVQHTCDVQMHARPMGTQGVMWVKDPENIGSTSAIWEAKDRTGRIKQTWNRPNFRLLLNDIYGEELRKQIYVAGTTQTSA